MNAIERACEFLGSQRAIASVLVVTPAAVNQWISGVRPIPEDRCPAIERATNGAITCEELRPDAQWIRIPDKAWPHQKGRPLLDHAAKVGAGDTAKAA